MNNIGIGQLLSRFNGFMQNPAQMLAQKGINIPQQMANDPNAIMQHLMSTGQLNQTQYNQAQQMAQQFRGMFQR